MKGQERMAEQLAGFCRCLQEEERELATIEKYLRDAKMFLIWLDGKEITKKQTTLWKEYLRKSGYEPVTVNGKLSAVNKLCNI